MSRKAVEILMLAVVLITLMIIDPFGLLPKWVAANIFAAGIAYAFIGAFITIIISKIVYSFSK